MGIAITADPLTDPHEIIRDADLALYRAKSKGRDRVELVDDALRREADRRYDIQHTLREAPARDELELQYQPIVRLGDERIVMLEALVRWPLKGLGARLAVDDFGTGFSALSWLKRFPVDILKVDRSFVARVDVVPQDGAIVIAVLQLARALGLQTLAEGVEHTRQAAVMARIGCHLGQGWRDGKPMPADELADVLHRGVWRARPATIRLTVRAGETA